MLVMKNNFQRLHDDEMNRVPDLSDTQREVRQRIEGMQTIGQVVELYLTKILDAFVMMTGGEVDSSTTNRKPRSGPPGSINRNDGPSGGPSAG